VHIQADDWIVPVNRERLHTWKTWHWRAQFLTKKRSGVNRLHSGVRQDLEGQLRLYQIDCVRGLVYG